MRKFIPLKFVSQLLLLAMFIVILDGAHESACAIQGSVSASGDSVIIHGEFSAPHTSHRAPTSEHKDFDGCVTCVSCACHAPLAATRLVLNYNPIVSSLRFFDPYQYLPEVFFSKLIPPRILA